MHTKNGMVVKLSLLRLKEDGVKLLCFGYIKTDIGRLFSCYVTRPINIVLVG